MTSPYRIHPALTHGKILRHSFYLSFYIWVSSEPASSWTWFSQRDANGSFPVVTGSSQFKPQFQEGLYHSVRLLCVPRDVVFRGGLQLDAAE